MWKATVRPFLHEHCVRCHGTDKQNRDLRLDVLAPEFDSSTKAGVWSEVIDKLNLSEMPPEDQPRPNATQQVQVARWIAGELRAARKRKVGKNGHVLMRRMNRAEYFNTIRDLFRCDSCPAKILPTVASLEANRRGLFDTHGNVWEWCSDNFHPRYYTELTGASVMSSDPLRLPVAVDPKGPNTTIHHQYGDWRAIRGVAWCTGPLTSR